MFTNSLEDSPNPFAVFFVEVFGSLEHQVLLFKGEKEGGRGRDEEEKREKGKGS